MKKTVCIVDDVEDEYLELKNILETGEWKDLITVADRYFTHRPYEQAKKYILEHKPAILFIDYDLKKGKTGDMLFKEVNNYDCYGIFLSRFHGEADAAAQFNNTVFLNKHIAPIVKPDRLNSALIRAFMYFEKDREVKLELYGDQGKKIETRIRCMDILLLEGTPGNPKTYKIQYSMKGSLVEKIGRCPHGVGPIAQILTKASNCFIVHKKHAYLVYNKWRFNLNLGKNQYESDEIFSGKKLNFPR